MLSLQLPAAFAFGLRHGADPDHLAAIDVVTRNAYPERPFAARFVGLMFAGGHGLMVIIVAALTGAVAGRIESAVPAVAHWAAIANVTILVTIAAANVASLALNGTNGVRTALLPRALRSSRTPWIAVPIGLIFGLGYETSGQVATFALAASADGGWLGGCAVGALFCLGVAITDGIDGLLVHRCISDPAMGRRVMRRWAWTVSGIALVVAGWQLALLLGWEPPVDELALSAAIVVAVALAFLTSLPRWPRVAVEKPQ